MEKTGDSSSSLLETLDELGEKDLKRFKYKLRRIQLKEGYQAIPWSQLEKGDQVDVTDLLIRHCGEPYGVEVAVQVLRDIHHRDLAEELREAVPAELFSQKQNSDPPPAPERGEEVAFTPEQESETPRHPEPEERDVSQERKQATQLVLKKLNLEKHRSEQLTLRDLQKISPESLEILAPITLGDLPWHFLRKIIALNGTARNTRLVHGGPGDQEPSEELEVHTDCNNVSLSHMDSAKLLCSDSFLQQEILSRMSMCQFALPLLLPALDSPRCTLLLWAMRDIVRRWRPHSLAQSRGFREESLVLTPMPTVSFVRLGSCRFSKSQLLNEVLSPAQQHHDFFVHRDMESGNVPREIADGLVEIAWYFPAGQENLDLFPEPVAVTNLRGDIESHWLQFSFLTQVSSAVFILTESVGEREYALLSSLQGSATPYYFIFNCKLENPEETLGFLCKLESALKLDKPRVLMRQNSLSLAQFVEKLQSTVGNLLESSPRATAPELGIRVDEDGEGCQNASQWAAGITAEIEDVAKYKRESLRLPEGMAKAEEEQRDPAPELHTSQQREEWLDWDTLQGECELTEGMVKFTAGLGKLSPVETHYFLKWMKYRLGHVVQGTPSRWTDYAENSHAGRDDPPHRAERHEPMSSSSLGVEHFLRGVGRFYEAECAMVKGGKKLKTQRKYTHLPGIAAELMLEGFPLELMDGDAANIPLQWVTDVLTELHAKLGGRSRMLVLSVMGGQGTGKSTLLNTMFGLQFAVSSGRCTRGAFMSLLKVAETFQPVLGCDCLLVIDTEGLKAPELAKLEDRYQHHNELVMLVVGLSDIVIVNMAMENATDMQDILQIMLDTFLKMEIVREHPNCQFVHQNVSDVSGCEPHMGDWYSFLQPPEEITLAAASTEKGIREMKCPDIIYHDPEKHSWYIPGFWCGVPPMAPVNIRYSQSVFELKKYLIECMRRSSSNRPLKDVPQLNEWVRSLWNAIKHSSSTFSLRNNFVAHTYNQLTTKYAEWEWDFRKEMHLWVSEQETFIQNQPRAELDLLPLSRFKHEAQQKLQHEEQRLLDALQKYIDSGAENLLLTGKYREDFIRSTNGLTKELKRYSFSKCKEALDCQNTPEILAHQIQAMNMQTMQRNTDRLSAHCRKRECEIDCKALELDETLAEFLFSHVQKIQTMVFQQTNDLNNEGVAGNPKLQQRGSRLNCCASTVRMKKEHLDFLMWTEHMREVSTNHHGQKAELVMTSLENGRTGRDEEVTFMTDYIEIFQRELPGMINERLPQAGEPVSSMYLDTDHEDHIWEEGTRVFQKSHEDTIKGKGPPQQSEKQKPPYLSPFRTPSLEKDAFQKEIQMFCEECLRPALMDYVHRMLGINIVGNFLNSAQATGYRNRSIFQFWLLSRLLEEMNFDCYVKYINNYEAFAKTWIWTHLLDHYKETRGLVDLQKELLSTVIKKIRDALENSKTQVDISGSFFKSLQRDLVISRDSLARIQLINPTNPNQFPTAVQAFLSTFEQTILAQFEDLDVESKLSILPLKPQEEIFKRVFGCGYCCPFCKVPCEAGGMDHKMHFASVHRPQGLIKPKRVFSPCLEKEPKIDSSPCSSGWLIKDSHVHRSHCFCEDEVLGYPSPADPSYKNSNYWKFVFKEFNQQFAREYGTKPADLPRDWANITQGQALESLEEAFKGAISVSGQNWLRIVQKKPKVFP
nr:up-regulator of cell proliferation-like [Pelodiscus sinensis]|eukprot:XP_014425403.2 up-regulator of cell proliferation-like [Pelodiscus sinensis]